jgi:hypothetical protein
LPELRLHHEVLLGAWDVQPDEHVRALYLQALHPGVIRGTLQNAVRQRPHRWPNSICSGCSRA